MADDNQNGSSSVKSNLFIAGMNKDLDDTFIQEGMWSHARNATKVTANGSLQTLSNEPSNLLCVTVPYTIIGRIHLFEDQWAIFSTDNTHSEIGVFDDSLCAYTPIKNLQGDSMDPINCLNFNTQYLITGISKQNFDCSYQVYFADNLNPDRTVNITKPQFTQTCVVVNNCNICTDTTQLNCEAILLASLVDSPCITVSRSRTGGSMLNGSYFAVIAYTINDQRVTDYFPPSNVQSLFEHSNAAGSLDITFSGLDTDHFTEFELVIVRTVNQQVSAKRIGIYSTHTKEVFIDNINESLVTIPIELIPIRNPVFEKSEAIYSVGDYAVRVAPKTKFDFNYQPLANHITCKWQSVEYPSDYYRRGGNVTSYLRDEIYPFFIRWIYNTGDRSSSYHIPGRPPQGNELSPNNTIDSISPGNELEFEVNNTASPTAFPNTTLPDGGVIIAEGNMAYWQSSEIYPDNRPDIWNASYHPWSNIFPVIDLCGKPIRHHKMPDNLTHPTTNHINPGASRIRILGVKFDNIRPPVDNNGIPIPGIEGYEILRGSREGNKTVIAKGMINNLRGYTTVNGTPGLYQNYPYNYRGPDPTLRTAESSGGWGLTGQPGADLTQVRRDIFTFHSPDTQFRHPFLAVNELKTYGENIANILGNFEDVPHHPKEKLLTDLAFLLAALVGVGAVMLAMRGQRTRLRRGPYVNNVGYYADVKAQSAIGGGGGTIPGAISPQTGGSRAAYTEEAPSTDSNAPDGTDAKTSVDNAQTSVYDPTTGSDPGAFSLATLGTLVLGLPDPGDLSARTSLLGTALEPGINYYYEDLNTQVPGFDYIPQSFKILNGIQLASNYWTIGTDDALRLIEAIVPYTQYAYRYRSHGFYNNIVPGNSVPGNRRYGLPSAIPPEYLDTQRQTFNNNEVNNLYRGQAVILKTSRVVPDPVSVDNSLVTISDSPGGYANPKIPFVTSSSSYYTALIQRFRNQYGQLDSIQQLNISCKYTINPNLTEQHTGTIFGGDTYISRYTEKNSFFYFYDWLYDQPDGYEFDYKLRYMITYPRFWANFTRYDAGEFLQGILSFTLTTPSDKAALDGNTNPLSVLNILGLRFRIKDAYFYLFQSGVRDFFVESEVNTDLRDWGEDPSERHYDPFRYTDTFALFEPKVIKTGNYFKYDYSLSISRLFINFISWGNLQPRYYDPLVAESCYVKRDNRLIYSLPQNLENTKDFWLVYLANNYRDFESKISVIKPTAKNGAIILFQSDSPLLFQGVDTLQTDLGTKVTLGDGGLFSQAQQSIVNVDVSYEYGSCQDRNSVINTPFGLFYMCTNQGKIFRATNQLDDITYHGLKFWFKEYLPFWLLKDFPDFDILDNPVVGIGCQAIYDNQIETIYFCKRDYKLKDSFKGTVTYQGNGIFSYNSSNGDTDTFSLGDPEYFQDASFTVSYDPKSQKGGWISFHDWHPNLNIPSRSNFLTTVDNKIWRHNQRRDSFCNYYNQDYPFELEWIASTQTTVNTLRSIEYYLECYKYAPGRLDKYQLLDFNFDHAIIYNSEQVSGILDLKLSPKNNPFGQLGYPKITLQPSFEILYSKEEQKYRIDTFGDITDNRGEFSSAQRMIWISDPNGYTRILNPLNLNYNKSRLQVKKFRHYTNKVLLSRKVSGAINMTIKVSVEKLELSLR